MVELQREREDDSTRWVWLEPGDDSGRVIAGLSLESDRIKVEALSVSRSARVGAGLAESIGELVELVDIHTEKITAENVAQKALGEFGRLGRDRNDES
jgi:hypothetical protein